jgi:predicted metal-binding membrane protein
MVRQDMDGMAMDDMPDMAMSMMEDWSLATFTLTFSMWWVMMLGMMLPSAAPMIVTFATINRSKVARGQNFVPTPVFVAGYLTIWGAFSLFATIAHWSFDRMTLLSPMLAVTSPELGGSLLILAGLYQFTPLKNVCLRNCRSPLAFVLNDWRDGYLGAFRMGLSHGLYCLGCCWALMAMLFVFGAMNLLWVAGIAIFVFIEKLFPRGDWIGRFGGGAMIALGVFLLAWN